MTKTGSHQKKIIFSNRNTFGEIKIFEIKKGGKSQRILFFDEIRQCGTEMPVAGIAGVIESYGRGNLVVARVGNACGFALARIANNPKISRIDAIEINPAMTEAMKFFENWTGPLIQNPKIRFITADANEYFSATPEKYNMIDIWVRSPEVPYSRPLYEEKFIKTVKSRLTRGGILSFWMAYNSSPDFEKEMERRLLKRFRYIFWHILKERYLLAADRPLPIT